MARGISIMPIYCIFGLFFLHSPFPLLATTPISPLPFSLPSFPFILPLPFHKEVSKKLSYRRQNALSVIKTHEP